MGMDCGIFQEYNLNCMDNMTKYLEFETFGSQVQYVYCSFLLFNCKDGEKEFHINRMKPIVFPLISR